MRTDYSPYTRVLEDGKVWWRLEDAIKLAAGYLPVRDDNGESHLLAGQFGGTPSEIAGRRNLIRVNETTLIGELAKQSDHPWIINDKVELCNAQPTKLVDAVQFLDWLWGEHKKNPELDFPQELHGLLSQAINQASKKQIDIDRSKYIAYPEAISILKKNFGATPEELAMWLCLGDSGIAAYRNANELDPPPRFSFVPHAASGEFDYVKPLMGCWFIRDAIASFNPQHRYITGRQLIENWSSIISHPDEFIRAKIRESRLIDGHPIMGLTQGSNPGDPSSPLLEDALFRTDQIEEIELSDFGGNMESAPTAKVFLSLNVDDSILALPASGTSPATLVKAKSEIWWHEYDILNIAQSCGDRLKRKGKSTSTRSIGDAVSQDIADRERRGEGRTAPDGGTIRNTILKGWKYKPE